MSPNFIINTKILEKNIDFMHEKAKKSNTIFRPHFKTHQSEEIGKLFLKKGIKQITVSSLKMAEFFADQGFSDITIAIPANLNQTKEVNSLANKIQLNIILANSEIPQNLLNKLNKKINIFIELDFGYNRSGIYFEKTDEIEELINKINFVQLNFVGFLSHYGNTYSAKSTREIIEIYKNSTEKFLEIKQKFNKFKPIISIGDTPSCVLADDFTGVDEIRPGNFVYYDLMQYALGVCKLSDISAFIKASVIARYPDRKELIIHAGAVHLSKEVIEFNKEKTYGKIVIIRDNKIQEIVDDMNIISLSQEHGIIRCSAKSFNNFKLYDEIYILPVHSCLTANLMKDCSSFI